MKAPAGEVGMSEVVAFEEQRFTPWPGRGRWRSSHRSSDGRPSSTSIRVETETHPVTWISGSGRRSTAIFGSTSDPAGMRASGAVASAVARYSGASSDRPEGSPRSKPEVAMMADGPRPSRQPALIARQPVRTEGALAHGSRMRRAVRGDDEQICGARLDGCGAVAPVRGEPARSRLHDARVDLPCQPAACRGELADVLVLNGRLGSTVSTFQRCESTGQIRWRTKPGDRPA